MLVDMYRSQKNPKLFLIVPAKTNILTLNSTNQISDVEFFLIYLTSTEITEKKELIALDPTIAIKEINEKGYSIQLVKIIFE